MTGMFYFAPGAAYLIFSIYMSRRHLWAVIACLALTSIELLIVFAGAVMSLFVLRRLPNTVMYITLGIIAVVILALGQLKCLRCVAEPLTRHGATNLFESAMCLLNVTLNAFKLQFNTGSVSLGGGDLLISN